MNPWHDVDFLLHSSFLRTSISLILALGWVSIIYTLKYTLSTTWRVCVHLWKVQKHVKIIFLYNWLKNQRRSFFLIILPSEQEYRLRSVEKHTENVWCNESIIRTFWITLEKVTISPPWEHSSPNVIETHLRGVNK